ncbi:MAG: transcription-repair coupling factor [Treponema sp.]|nr:transcription-repair coupling factor [Treponema sp.]
MNSSLSNESNSLFNSICKWTEFRESIDFLLHDTSAYPAEIEGLQGSLHSFFAAAFMNSRFAQTLHSIQYNESFSSRQALDSVIVVPSEKNAQDVASDLHTILPESEVYILPWWGMVAYRPVAKGAVVFGERAGILAKLVTSSGQVTVSSHPRFFIVTQRVFQTPVPPPSYIKSLIFRLTKGQKIDTIQLSEQLVKCGYIRVPKVSVKGEFTLRGEVLDIFLPSEDSAHRILFDFDEIERIKTFDVETQSTIASVDELLIYPMKEVVWTDELIQTLSDKVTACQKENGILELTTEAQNVLETLLTELQVQKESEGEELFYPLLWDKKYSILDYIADTVPVIYYDYNRLENAQEGLNREYIGMYRKIRSQSPYMPPQEITFQFDDLVAVHDTHIKCKSLHTQVEESIPNKNTLHIESSSAQSFFGNIQYLKEHIRELQQLHWHIYIYADNPNQQLRIDEILKNYTHPEIQELEPVHLLPEQISEGFSIPDLKTLVIQENEIFGRRKQAPKSLHKVKSAVIDTFVDLNPGDYVVHVKYGIGIFKGIERIHAMGNERDYIKIEYADEEFAFVPIEQVNLVQRYIGNEGNAPRIDRIGSKSWENRKNRVKKSVEELAQKLINLYSRRQIAQGFAFPKDSEWQLAFEAAFPYEDTPDQMTVTQEVKQDMEKPVPMDRLVCGDVGYGKTEIAMRAAFKAVMGGKQVAFLAPTTILAEQHYENCIDRFEKFPVKIAHMSRFVTQKEQKKVLKQLAAGEIDILVGTHRIIQKDVVFKNLGLMIIDEEQRFGVKDKEKLKVLKNNIDCLTMSATPIPRTLHMSLLKIRDMSLLTTPPQNRQPIETVIDGYNDDRVAMAIRREVERGGQVFYLHNRVETLEETRHKLEQLVPEMMVDIAHGQMSSEQLDDIFRRFKMGGFHILVATTIIENGIDIPNVNTIIIDRADMYGVSQLYQLRGRVGRSDRKAYAYLFYPENKALSEIAMKRLQVISDFTELGSGFKIAMKDMEIRGAGNLLGVDQSGDVYSVGFDMYLRLLNEAVQQLTEENYKENNEVLMELEYTGFIPDTYVHNLQTKMEIYKKIAGVQTKEELDRVYDELQDRFGPVPDEVVSLLSLAQIRIICQKLYISALKERQGVVQIIFSKVANVSIDKLLKMIKMSPNRVRLDPTQMNVILLETGKIGLKEKSEFIREKLEYLV